MSTGSLLRPIIPLSPTGMNMADKRRGSCHSWDMTTSPVNSATTPCQHYPGWAHTTCVPAERCLSQSPLFARCMSVVLPLMSTISHNPLVVQSPSHAPLAIPLVKTIWEHCSCLCETFLEAFALFSSPLLSPTLFLGFFSLESLCLVFHFQFWVSPRSEC